MRGDENFPAVSVIIVVWNNGKLLRQCLSKLVRQTIKDFDIVVIDNGSTDERVKDILDEFPSLNLQLKILDRNVGFSAANNLGAQLAQGRLIALLNADAFPEPDWLEQLLEAERKNPDFTFFTSRQIQANSPHLLDGTGDAYHVSGLAWRWHYNQSVEEFGDKQVEVFSACAAAALYRKSDFMKIGGFDEEYFSYFEDVDLSFRLRLTGGKCLYIPKAIVHHVGSASTGKASDFSYYYGHRNLVWTFFKDMPAALFWLYLPLHMAMNIYLSFVFLLRNKNKVVMRSKWDAFRLLPAILHKRRTVQRSRVVSTWEIYRTMTKDLFAPKRAGRGRSR